MSSWGFDKEGTQNAGGANTEDFLVRGFQPFHQADSVASKRNVIGTDLGWVRRVNYTDMHGNARKKEEVIVAANPGSGSYADADHLGFPDISQIYVKLNVNGVVTANATANVYVVFNQPVKVKPSSNVMSIAIANTAGGNNINAYLLTQGAAGNTGIAANNTLIFTTPAIQGGTGSAKGTYKVQGQSITVAGGGNPVYNPEIGVTATANLTIVGAVSNNMLSGVGQTITTFQVSPGGV